MIAVLFMLGGYAIVPIFVLLIGSLSAHSLQERDRNTFPTIEII